MYIGHISIAESFNSAGEHFVRLIESLRQRFFEQYLLFRNVDLAKRPDLVDGVTVGPVEEIRNLYKGCGSPSI